MSEYRDKLILSTSSEFVKIIIYIACKIYFQLICNLINRCLNFIHLSARNEHYISKLPKCHAIECSCKCILVQLNEWSANAAICRHTKTARRRGICAMPINKTESNSGAHTRELGALSPIKTESRHPQRDHSSGRANLININPIGLT